MEGTLVDFVSGVSRIDDSIVADYERHYDDIPGVFSKMDPMPGTVDAARALAK